MNRSRNLAQRAAHWSAEHRKTAIFGWLAFVSVACSAQRVDRLVSVLPPAAVSAGPTAPAFVLGLGLGGFIDGILLHQILQWHHLLTGTGDHPSDTVSGLEANTLADGFFHLATWFLVAAAMVLTVRAWRRRELAPPRRAHIGMTLAGWGVFNLVEGLIDHQLLGIHHVRDDLGGPLGWDLAFLGFGVLLIVGGLALARPARGSSLGPR